MALPIDDYQPNHKNVEFRIDYDPQTSTYGVHIPDYDYNSHFVHLCFQDAVDDATDVINVLSVFDSPGEYEYV